MKSENWIVILNTNNFHQLLPIYSRNYSWKISSKIRVPGNIKRTGIIKTLEFIEATRIAIRSWHLNRMHEEEEEEGGEEEGGPED
ncbi:predicted protein [Sclerotinia sclerotiorum 1980 UF-70]|uniref:Uncharacterized protein n=1 Tax=Sclerotinia sclerotiorum (strain ATCC 18683 / 1980 / Ss-1) TaxID=665079 RepID=A7E595_SCLS1|nr:predicted protein [Sclerotinia sclerotiorum 1980 UF-70]EDN91067.1 predicted protein [Sclerotinia sclerotiorum 1980 UF-70]